MLTRKQEKKKGKKKSAKHSGSANAASTMAAMTGQPAPASATTTAAAPQIATSKPQQRNLSPRVEEVFDED
jgi:translocation protein SEC62